MKSSDPLACISWN